MSRVLSKNVENHSRDLLVRTDAERAWMWRMAQPVDPEGRARRVANHMTQQEAATLLGISRAGYKQLEDGRKVRLEVDFDTVATTNSQFDLAALRSILQKITEAAEPTLGQLCALARRRSGRRIGDLAAELGTTRVTYLTWENESDPRLVEWWRDQGYTLPITPLGSRVLAMRR